MNNTAGRRLREGRKLKGLSQQALAEIVGNTRQTVIEHEKHGPPEDMIIVYARALGVSREWLKTGNGVAKDVSDVHISDPPPPNRPEFLPLVMAEAVVESQDGMIQRVTFKRSGPFMLVNESVFASWHGEGPEAYIEWRVTGDSMSPEINPGDLLRLKPCNPGEAPQNHAVYIVHGSFAWSLVRLNLTATEARLCLSNPNYEDVCLPYEEFVQRVTLVAKVHAKMTFM